jgi:hypothetical protein
MAQIVADLEHPLATLDLTGEPLRLVRDQGLNPAPMALSGKKAGCSNSGLSSSGAAGGARVGCEREGSGR